MPGTPDIPTPHRGGQWDLQGAVPATLCAKNQGCPVPAGRSCVTLCNRHHDMSLGTMEGGGGGKWVISMRHPTWIFSSPSLLAPCLLAALRDALVSSGVGREGTHHQPLPTSLCHR